MPATLSHQRRQPTSLVTRAQPPGWTAFRLASLLIGLVCAGFAQLTAGAEPPAGPVALGSRRELFVDDFLIDRLSNVRLELQHPQPKEVVFACDRPWEGNTCIYFRIIPEEGRIRMWYQGAHWQLDPQDPRPTHPYHICYAESTDGLTWTKPNLGLIEVDGSKDNNIVVTGVYDNFTPFRDTNPACPPEARYKALGQSPQGLIAWQSPDGLNWRRLGDAPVIRQGAFDSQNVGFWDPVSGTYRAYVRDFHDGQRDIRLALSKDFQTWTTPERLALSPAVAREQFYTNCIDRYHRAPHLFLGFPARYVERKWSPSMRAFPIGPTASCERRRKNGSGPPSPMASSCRVAMDCTFIAGTKPSCGLAPNDRGRGSMATVTPPMDWSRPPVRSPGLLPNCRSTSPNTTGEMNWPFAAGHSGSMASSRPRLPSTGANC